MAKCYQYTADGYYAGEAEDSGLLPNNATRTIPTLVDGKVPRWTGKKWVQVEDHRGESGYVNGVTTEIKEYGPLPDGWSVTPPPPTLDQLFAAMRASRDARLAATDKYLLVDYPISEGDLALVKAYRAALRDLPDQPGAPWDGGGEETPWPELPKT